MTSKPACQNSSNNREDVTKKVEILGLENFYKEDLVRSVMEKVAAGEACHLNDKHILEQYKNQFFDGNYSDKVHISEEYGQYMSYFLPTNPHADPIIVKAYNLIIKQTKESGIYDLLVKVYSKKRERMTKALAEYSGGKLEHFVGLFVICGAFLAFALLVFLFESLMLLRKKCNGATSTEADDTDRAVLRLQTATDDTCSSYFRRRMSILDVVWAELLETPSTSNNTVVQYTDAKSKA